MATVVIKRPMGKKRLLDLLASRAFIYSVLKRVFIEEPTADFLKLLTEEGVLSYLPWRDENGSIKEGVDTVIFYLRDPDLLSSDSVMALGSDYVNLFVGPGKMTAAPWESVYRSARRGVFQEHTLEVRNEYARQKLQAANFSREPDDHIALELDFMRELTERAAGSIRKDLFKLAKKQLQTQRKFLNEHLMKWAPDFADKIEKNARTDFYRGFGRLLGGWLVFDAAKLDELIKHLGARISRQRDRVGAGKPAKLTGLDGGQRG